MIQLIKKIINSIKDSLKGEDLIIHWMKQIMNKKNRQHKKVIHQTLIERLIQKYPMLKEKSCVYQIKPIFKN